MSVRKRNEYLEGDESEEDFGNGYDSDADEESRGILAGRTTKRRRVEPTSDEESLGEIEDNVSNAPNHDEHDQTGILHEDQSIVLEEVGDETEEGGNQVISTTLKPSTPKQVAAAQKAARRSGVVYISRVPPFMKPQTLKHFLAPHASKGVGRLFLTPEDHDAHSRRVKSGGNKKKSYTDGWVEFVSKREAKIAVELLNGNIIGGKKGNFYHDDLWSMKYLKGFKWSHLTEQIANENAERAARMREEVRRTRQENKAFLEDVERGKMLEGMEAKRRAKQDAVDSGTAAKTAPPNKSFKQKPARQASKRDVPSQQASRLQGMIF